MTRRQLIATATGAAFAPYLLAKGGWDKSRISAITDEIGLSTEEAIAFAHHYGMTHVEIRNPAGDKREYFTLPEADIKADAALFAREGLKVTFINTSLLKFTWPGMEPTRRNPEAPDAREKRLATEKSRWDRRMDDLAKVIKCAQIMGCDKVRVFAGSRVPDNRAQFQRIADTVGEMSKTAEREGIFLLIENEGSQNIATSAELADILGMIPAKAVGGNWDPHNAYGKETSYPDGYKLLPINRIYNIQVKGKGVMPKSPEREDWKGIMESLDRDGYKGKIGLETHLFDGTLITAAHASMDEIMRIVQEA